MSKSLSEYKWCVLILCWKLIFYFSLLARSQVYSHLCSNAHHPFQQARRQKRVPNGRCTKNMDKWFEYLKNSYLLAANFNAFHSVTVILYSNNVLVVVDGFGERRPTARSPEFRLWSEKSDYLNSLENYKLTELPKSLTQTAWLHNNNNCTLQLQHA